MALGEDRGAGRTKAFHNAADPRKTTRAATRTDMRRSNMQCYPRGFAVRSSNNVYESALVHTPTRPGPLNVRSCASMSFLPSQYYLYMVPLKLGAQVVPGARRDFAAPGGELDPASALYVIEANVVL